MLDQNTIENFTKDPSTMSKGRAGMGSYATVHKTEFENLVIKESETMFSHEIKNGEFSDGWIAWAAFCMEHGDKYKFCPKIYSLKIDTVAGKFWALMEKYENLDKAPWITLNYDKDQSQFLSRLIFQNFYGLSDDDLLETATVCVDFATWIEKHNICNNDNIYIDAHDENWMDSDEGIKMTDPITFTTEIRNHRRGRQHVYNAMMEKMKTMKNVRIT